MNNLTQQIHATPITCNSMAVIDRLIDEAGGFDLTPAQTKSLQDLDIEFERLSAMIGAECTVEQTDKAYTAELAAVGKAAREGKPAPRLHSNAELHEQRVRRSNAISGEQEQIAITAGAIVKPLMADLTKRAERVVAAIEENERAEHASLGAGSYYASARLTAYRAALGVLESKVKWGSGKETANSMLFYRLPKPAPKPATRTK